MSFNAYDVEPLACRLGNISCLRLIHLALRYRRRDVDTIPKNYASRFMVMAHNPIRRHVTWSLDRIAVNDR